MAKPKAGWTTTEVKAIGYYAQTHDLRMTLCGRPNVKYVDSNGKQVEVDISTVSRDYDIFLKEDRLEKIRQKKEDERAELMKIRKFS